MSNHETLTTFCTRCNQQSEVEFLAIDVEDGDIWVRCLGCKVIFPLEYENGS